MAGWVMAGWIYEWLCAVTCGRQERVLDPLGLELKEVVNFLL